MDADIFGIVGSTQAGFFRIDRVVAEGGFGVVYQAFHTAFRAPVALKCLKVPETMTPADRDAFLEKFREEGEMLFRLSSASPVVVRPLHVDAITLEGGRFVPFLALEWLEGEPFDVIIHRRSKQGKTPLGIRSLVPFLQPIAQALAQAHAITTVDGQVAIIHRDIKPDNIFVVRAHGRESVRILDFGIARAKSAASLHAGEATTGNMFDAFTPGYAAPEQWLPKRFGQTGPWTDVWGLALTMVEALTGDAPIGNDDIAAMMGAALDPTYRPTPRYKGADVPDAVEQAFLRALAIDPRERTQSIEAFWTELETGLDMPSTFRAAPRPMLSSGASFPPPPMSARSTAETQLASSTTSSSTSMPVISDPALLSLDGIGFAPNEQVSSIPPARINVTPVERLSPLPPGRTSPLPVGRISQMPSDRTSPVPPGRITQSPQPPQPPDSLRVDVDIGPPRQTTGPRPIAASAEKTQSRSFRVEIAPDSRPPESQRAVDWADIWWRLQWPTYVMLISVAIIVAEVLYPHMTANTAASVGVRPMWAASAVATIGLGWACFRLFFGR